MLKLQPNHTSIAIQAKQMGVDIPLGATTADLRAQGFRVPDTWEDDWVLVESAFSESGYAMADGRYGRYRSSVSWRLAT